VAVAAVFLTTMAEALAEHAMAADTVDTTVAEHIIAAEATTVAEDTMEAGDTMAVGAAAIAAGAGVA